MPLDPHIAEFLRNRGSAAPSSVHDIRRATEINLPKLHGPLEDVASIETHLVPSHDGHPVRVRSYVPSSMHGADQRAAVVYAHGGGWFQCSLELYDNPCRALANAIGCVVLSVDYRLAPENPFPVPLEDYYATLCWAVENASALGIDPARVVVGGDSAGGNLAAGAALLARDRNGPVIAHQLLLYPPLDRTFSTPSYNEFSEGYFLTRATMQSCWNWYVGNEADISRYAAPLRAESLKGLPSATILVNEYDPLRDEGEAYAQRLREAGIDVWTSRLSGLVHASIHMLGLTPEAHQLHDAARLGVRRALKSDKAAAE